MAATTPASTLALRRRSRGASQSTRHVSAADLAPSRSTALLGVHSPLPRPALHQPGGTPFRWSVSAGQQASTPTELRCCS
eukprot:11455577-Alexandrium_andersonii.AAC.1